LTQSVLRWPEPEALLEATRQWAEDQGKRHPSLLRVGVFGSYGRGEASVGSDLDLVLIDDGAIGPQHLRLRAWPLERLPLTCDALVLTSEEWDRLMGACEPRAGSHRFASELRRDLRWLWCRQTPPHPPGSGSSESSQPETTT
jgi:hypothetical protein